jgi:hypothetical protein
MRHDSGERLTSGMRSVAALVIEFALIAFVVTVVFFAVKGVVSLGPGQGP